MQITKPEDLVWNDSSLPTDATQGDEVLAIFIVEGNPPLPLYIQLQQGENEEWSIVTEGESGRLYFASDLFTLTKWAWVIRELDDQTAA